MAKDAGMTQDEGRRAAAGGRGRNSQLSGRGIWYPQEQRHGSFTMTGAGLGLSTQLTCGAGRGQGPRPALFLWNLFSQCHRKQGHQ